jgi:AraC family transcriptional regulator
MKDIVVAPLPARPEYILAHAIAPGLRCAESFYPSRLAVTEHVHDKASITIILAGSFIESKGRVAKARCDQGAAIFRCAGEPHANLISGAGALNLELELGDRLASICELAELRSSMVVHPAIASAAARLRSELRIRDRAQPLLMEGLALEIAGYATRRSLTAPTRRPPPWLLRVHARLCDGFLDDVSPGELAREAGVHPVSLLRAFRVHFGTSPGAFVRARRVSWAAERLLREPNLRVTEVALAAGFYDHSHFARVFKALLGSSPVAYRQARQSKRR